MNKRFLMFFLLFADTVACLQIWEGRQGKQRRIGSTQMKLLLLSIIFFFSFSFFGLYAQVTVGDGIPPQSFSILEIVSNSTGGVRLPQLTSAERDILSNTPEFKAENHRAGNTQKPGLGLGLTIYNTDTNCIEYWNGQKWISLCSGNSSFTGGDCANNPIPHEGGKVSCAITDPNCETEGEYTFTIISGNDYAALTVTDAGAGKFDLVFDANDRANDRQVLVMVTSPCGNSNIFVYNQKGDATGCGVTTVPDIKSVDNITTMCTGGAVYLHLEGYPEAGSFIWTLNGQVVGAGYSYAATQPGKYIVYGDKIGCPGSKEIQITLDGTGAPLPVQLIVVGNNGEACGANGTVRLVTSKPVSGNVIWFCDGKHTNLTGTDILAGKGYWQAVVVDDNCKSTPSDGVTVTEELSGGTLPEPKMIINGLTSGWKLCRAGSVFLEVDNPDPLLTYTWYADNTQIGTGSGIYFLVPSAQQVVIRLRVTGTGCAKEAMSVETISTDQAPAAPYISCNTPGNVLCGGEAVLMATGGDSYRWFRNGTEITGQTGSSLKITETGTYTVTAISTGGCISVQSGAMVISTSDFATLSWISNPATATVGDTKTYSISTDFSQNVTYNWTVTNAAIITNGQGTSSITVQFPNAGTIGIVCQSSNACGTAMNSPLSQVVTVSAGCNDAHIMSHSDLTPDIKSGQKTIMSITATGTGVSYQWYSGTKGSGTIIAGATSAGYEYAASAIGTYRFYCIASVAGGCNSAESQQFTVTVSANPSTIPTGTGSFTGKTCFDIANSNDNTYNCGPLGSRTNQKTDFANRTAQDPAVPPYTGVQVYTFTPSGRVSNVRFDYVDPTGKVIESMTPNSTSYTGNSISSPCKVTVAYNASLNNDLIGLTRANPLKADLYVIYNDGPLNNGTDQAIKLTATLQDCACCGAATKTGGWLNFMCHNLGADDSLDPFSYLSKGIDVDYDIKGYLYQWGRATDGHQERSSEILREQANSNTPGHKKFIVHTAPSADWRYGGGNISRWGNGTQDENPPKAANDPCPDGWKVPSQKQWASIIAGDTRTIEKDELTRLANGTGYPNKWEWTGNGFKVGDALYLPGAGFRSNAHGVINGTDYGGGYWSSTVSGTNSYAILFDVRHIEQAIVMGRAIGYSIRCVSLY